MKVKNGSAKQAQHAKGIHIRLATKAFLAWKRLSEFMGLTDKCQTATVRPGGHFLL
jgi:hypothetical protein